MNSKTDLQQANARMRLIKTTTSEITTLRKKIKHLETDIHTLSTQQERDVQHAIELGQHTKHFSQLSDMLLEKKAVLTLIEVHTQLSKNNKTIQRLISYFRQQKKTEESQVQTPERKLQAEVQLKKDRLEKIQSRIQHLEQLESSHSRLTTMFRTILKTFGLANTPAHYKEKETKRLEAELVVLTRAVEIEQSQTNQIIAQTSITVDQSQEALQLKQALITIKADIQQLTRQIHTTQNEASQVEKLRIKPEHLIEIADKKFSLEQDLKKMSKDLEEKTTLLQTLQQKTAPVQVQSAPQTSARSRVINPFRDTLFDIKTHHTQFDKNKQNHQQFTLFGQHLAVKDRQESTNVAANNAILKITNATNEFKNKLDTTSKEHQDLTSIATQFMTLQMSASNKAHSSNDLHAIQALQHQIEKLPEDNPLRTYQDYILHLFMDIQKKPSVHPDAKKDEMNARHLK
ncbi:MAG: hypothetical protein CK424_07865 [Legionella sp.]|nr:MAG: hypothetical protein CK424_07865 [Legionella sp.]